jgi:hypothetical protein
VLDPVTGICVLQCLEGYYNNLRVLYAAAPTPNDQLCVLNNCKAMWANPDDCIKCWSKEDIELDEKWIGRVSYAERNIEARDIEVPFELDIANKRCRLNCKQGFWSNLESTNNKAANANAQICSSDNCKSWGHHSIDSRIEVCTACWDKTDLAVYENFDGRGSYTVMALSGRDVENPFV